MTAVATTALEQRLEKVDVIKSQLQAVADRIQATSFRGFSPQRVLSGFLQAAQENPKLLECTPLSVVNELGKVARWGLDIGDGVHLVPFNQKVKRGGQDVWVTTLQAIPDYRGLKALLMRQRIIKQMTEYVVYENDEFEMELGLEQRLRHRPTMHEKRGRLTGAYTIITDTRHERSFHYMSIEEIEGIRANSKSWSPKAGFKDCPEWYAEKTVVRDWANKQPKSGGSVLDEALSADDTEFETIDPDTGEVLTGRQQLTAGETA